MNELNFEILVNGESFVIDSHKLLSAIVEIIPDEDERFQKLFEEAAKSLSKDVRCKVASKENLNAKTVMQLLQDEDTTVLIGLINAETAQTVIGYDDLQRMIEDVGSTDLLIAIAENITEFTNCDPNWIAEKLILKDDPSVRLALAYNPSTPKHILKRLLNDKDGGVRFEAKDSLENYDGELDILP